MSTAPDSPEVPTPDAGSATDGVTAPRTLGVGELMIAIALVGVCLGVFRENLGLGIVTASVACLALGRTLGVIARRKAGGATMTPREKALTLLASTGIALLIVAISTVAFFTVGSILLCFAFLLLGDRSSSLHGPHADLAVLLLIGAASLTAAVVVASGLRRDLWSWGENAGASGRRTPR